MSLLLTSRLRNFTTRVLAEEESIGCSPLAGSHTLQQRQQSYFYRGLWSLSLKLLHSLIKCQLKTNENVLAALKPFHRGLEQPRQIKGLEPDRVAAFGLEQPGHASISSLGDLGLETQTGQPMFLILNNRQHGYIGQLLTTVEGQ